MIATAPKNLRRRPSANDAATQGNNVEGVKSSVKGQSKVEDKLKRIGR